MRPCSAANPQHTGVFNSPAIATLSGIKWKFHTKGMVVSSPAVVNDTLYIGSTDHNLYALNASDGRLKWKFQTGSRVTSSPAVSDGTLYFASYDSNFYAVDIVTGKLKWQFKTGGEHRFAASHLHGSNPAAETMPDPFDFFLSSPIVWQGAVYFGSGDGNIYALETATGKAKWQFHTGDVVHASPTISEGVVYIGAGIVIFMRWMRPPERKSGASKPVKITTSITRWVFNRRQLSPMALSISAVETRTSMPWTRTPGRRSGFLTTKDRGSSALQQWQETHFISLRRIPGNSMRSMHVRVHLCSC
jgi:hypothetical protein